MNKHSKRYEAAIKMVESKDYTPREAVELIKKLPGTKFDETVALHLRMGLDPRNATQQVQIGRAHV